MKQLWEQFGVQYFAREHKDCKIYGSKHQPLSLTTTLLLLRNKADPSLEFTNTHEGDSKVNMKEVLWSTRTKFELCEHCALHCNKWTANTRNHTGGSIVL